MGEIFRNPYKKSDDETDEKPTSLILKTAPRSLLRREKSNSRNVFLREIFLYDTVRLHFRKIKNQTIKLLRRFEVECLPLYLI